VAAVKGLYESLQQQAQSQMDTVKEEAHAQVEVARQAQAAAETRTRKVEAKLSQKQATDQRLVKEKATLKTAWRTRSGPSSRCRRGRAEGLRQRLEDQTQTRQDLKHQLAQTQANLEHYRESVRQQREQERADFERQNRQLARP